MSGTIPSAALTTLLGTQIMAGQDLLALSDVHEFEAAAIEQWTTSTRRELHFAPASNVLVAMPSSAEDELSWAGVTVNGTQSIGSPSQQLAQEFVEHLLGAPIRLESRELQMTDLAEPALEIIAHYNRTRYHSNLESRTTCNNVNVAALGPYQLFVLRGISIGLRPIVVHRTAANKSTQGEFLIEHQSVTRCVGQTMHVDRTRTLRPAIPNHAPKWGKRIRASDKSSLTYAEVRWLVVQPPSQDQFEVVIASNLETLESVEFKQAEPALEYLGDDPVLVERSDYSRHDTEWTPPVQGYFSEGTAAQFRPTVEPYVDATARVKSPVESCASWFSHGVLVRAWAKKSTIARFAPGIAVSALVCSWIAHTWALVYPERPWNGIFQGSPIMSIPGQIVLPAVAAGFSLWAVLHQGGVVRYERSLRYVKFARNDIIEIVVYVGAAILLLPLARESTGIIRLNAAVYLMSTIAIRFSSRIDVAKRNRAWHVKNRPEST